METPLLTTIFLVLVGAAWHWRFARATRVRAAEAFSLDCLRAGALLLPLGLALFSGRIDAPTTAESLATIVFDGGGAALLILGLVGWASSNDTAIALANLTGETLVFVDAEGELLFTLLPQLGREARTLPPPLPGLYLIVPPMLVQNDDAARRSDLRLVDERTTRRASDGERLLVRRLRLPASGEPLHQQRMLTP